MRVLLAVLISILAIQLWRKDGAIKSDLTREQLVPVKVGMRLPNTKLLRYDAAENLALSRNTDAEREFGIGCRILIVFASTCPYCENIASAWSGLDSVSLGDGHASVHWITVIPADTGAADFVARHKLPTPWFAFASRGDRLRAGVGGWPHIRLVVDGITLSDSVSRNPKKLGEKERGLSCKS